MSFMSLTQGKTLVLEGLPQSSSILDSTAPVTSSSPQYYPFSPSASQAVEFDVSLYNSSPPVVPVAPTTPKTVKQRRYRVTTQQLFHLEHIFTSDRNPTASHRREISGMLGMSERQTQVWFQNRRVKAKMLEKQKQNSSVDPGKYEKKQVSIDTEILDIRIWLLDGEQDIELIACTDISIGNWRRIASTPHKNDVITYLCYMKECLTWLVMFAGRKFKMVLPLDIVVAADFTRTASDTGLVHLNLSEPPQFFMQSLTPHSQLVWTWCADWTEGSQASQILQHELRGSAVHLESLAKGLRSRFSNKEDLLVSTRVMAFPPSPLLSPGLDYTATHSSPPSPPTNTASTFLDNNLLTGPIQCEACTAASATDDLFSTSGPPPCTAVQTPSSHILVHGYPIGSSIMDCIQSIMPHHKIVTRSFSAPVIYHHADSYPTVVSLQSVRPVPPYSSLTTPFDPNLNIYASHDNYNHTPNSFGEVSSSQRLP